MGYTVVKGDVSALPSDGVVVIPQTYGSNNLPVTSIGTYAFYECTGINTVTIPRNVYTIGENAFSDCTNLKRVEFEENSNLNSLEDYVFGFCNMLEYVFVPASVKYITKYAFWSASTNGIVFEEQTSWYQTTGSYPGTHITDITIPNYFVGSGGLYNTLAGGNYTDLYPEE